MVRSRENLRILDGFGMEVVSGEMLRVMWLGWRFGSAGRLELILGKRDLWFGFYEN